METNLYGVILRAPVGNGIQIYTLEGAFATRAEALAAGLKAWGIHSRHHIHVFTTRIENEKEQQ